ncbi:hypothetical protein ISS85_05515 [Candidatus Microgenomates bacterium]|nr:hypothetical protein [Candidatus Microgenomates bacterium]
MKIRPTLLSAWNIIYLFLGSILFFGSLIDKNLDYGSLVLGGLVIIGVLAGQLEFLELKEDKLMYCFFIFKRTMDLKRVTSIVEDHWKPGFGAEFWVGLTRNLKALFRVGHRLYFYSDQKKIGEWKLIFRWKFEDTTSLMTMIQERFNIEVKRAKRDEHPLYMDRLFNPKK